ncbi:MAG: hypothetical protein IJ946_02740 [Clostridia bacterium]|nr:hypothetical protein [Clostridia bacterium]
MSDNLKETWVSVGKELGDALLNLSKAVVKTGTRAYKTVEKWVKEEAEKDNNKTDVNK